MRARSRRPKRSEGILGHKFYERNAFSGKRPLPALHTTATGRVFGVKRTSAERVTHAEWATLADSEWRAREPCRSLLDLEDLERLLAGCPVTSSSGNFDHS
jgi:hypothetical protein